MCKHQYQHHEEFKRQSKTRTCFCSMINKAYQQDTKYQSIVVNWHLPMDKNGLCVLHSPDIAWKRQYDIPQIIRDLIALTDLYYKNSKKNKRLLEYDFSECIITGRPLRELPLKGRSKYAIYFDGLICQSTLNFSNCTFVDGVILKNSNLNSTFNFKNTIFKEPVLLKNLVVNYGDFDYVQFCKDFTLSDTIFKMYTSFDYLKAKADVNIRHTTFEGITSFENMVIASDDNFDYLKEFIIKDVCFKDEVRFNNSIFKGIVSFDKLEFYFEAEFYNTNFAIGRASHDRLDTLSFTNLSINKKAKLSFRGNLPFSMLFTADTNITFNTIEGLVIFENIDLSTLNQSSKSLIFRLEKEEKLHIGKGCEKYRVRSETLTIKASKSTQHLILELTRVFSNYFGLINRFNLGVEILVIENDFIKYFFFTDDEMSKSEFNNIINQTQSDFWKLLSDVPNFQNQALNSSEEENEMLLAKSYILVDLNSILTKLGVKFKIDKELPFNVLKALELGGKIQLNKNLIESISKNNYTQIFNIYLDNKTKVIGNNNIIAKNINDSDIDINQ